MGYPLLESKIKRLRGEIKQLESQRAKAAKDESDAIKKINRANAIIGRTKSAATIKTKQREIERENNKIHKAKEKQADCLQKTSKKNAELNKALNELSQARQKEQDKLFREQEQRLQQFKAQQELAATSMATTPIEDEGQKEYDVFISHASEDKDDYVNELVEALKASNITIWYDDEAIGWGQSIRQQIDRGLSHSRYGIVVISPSFIKKYWTNYELNGILSKEATTGKQMILPIWHKVTADEVKKYSHSLSNILALNSAFNTIDEIVENLEKLLK